MNERPIIFSSEMVRAILDGRKTMTRRVIKPQPEVDPKCVRFADQRFIIQRNWKCPYGQPGDRLWVRESWWHHKECRPPFEHTGPQGCVRYTALEATHAVEPGRWLPEWYEKKSALFMPRWASRILLEITAVRVERVQGISPDDVQREGLDVVGKLPAPFAIPKLTQDKAVALIKKIAQDQFRIVWDSLNAKRGYGWDVNPWVWSISFKRIQP